MGRTHLDTRIYISVDGNVTHGENGRPATQPSSFSLKSRRLTVRASRLVDGSDGAGARREGGGETERDGGRERGGAGLNGGRRRAAWAALDEQNVELGSNSAEGEEGEEEPRRWDELAMGHSILCVASFRPI